MWVMPEISLSTNAGGWYHSGMNAQCPFHACKSARDIPNDVNNKLILPVVAAVIQELRSIFSSRYIHLGSDARRESMACFDEARINPDFLSFEENLAKLMGLEGILPRHVVRWGNENNEIYPGRFGSITQCRPGEACHVAKRNESTSWFGTVNLREGGAWKIYQSTYTLARQQPQALLADFDKFGIVHFREHNIPMRLLAFALGTTNTTEITNRTVFEQEYTTICKSYFSTSWYADLCDSFATNDAGIDDISFSVTEEYRQQVCDVRTYRW